MSKFNGKKTNNAKINAKKDIRNIVLSLIDKPAVIEVFCGKGEMFNDVWKNADYYLGIDKVKVFDERNTICADANKAIKQIDLSRFNIFDIDAYGSPYSILLECAKKIGNHERIGFVITDGVAMDLRMGRLCKGIRDILNIDEKTIGKAHLIHDDLIAKIIESIAITTKMHIRKIMFSKGKTGAAMRYYAFILTKSADCSLVDCHIQQEDRAEGLS